MSTVSQTIMARMKTTIFYSYSIAGRGGADREGRGDACRGAGVKEQVNCEKGGRKEG